MTVCFELAFFMHPPKPKEVLEEKREAAVISGSKVKNKGSETSQGNKKHFALGFLVKRTATSPNRKPAVPESNPR